MRPSRDRREGLKQSLVVVLERDVGGRKRIFDQAIKHAARLRTAVDIVAEGHGQSSGPMSLDIASDRADRPLKQIQPTVDVADRIDALQRI
jgi:hypothetical protein